MTVNRFPQPRRESGFTLVEMLVVIAIIGVLAALLVPTIGSAMRKAETTAIALEISMMQAAVQHYKTNHGDYPPDFSDRNVVNRHLRKAFPNMEPSEKSLMNVIFWVNPNAAPTDSNYHDSRVQPAEALVLFVGALSDDKRRPFTGTGGPIVVVNNSGQVTRRLSDIDAPVEEHFLINPDRAQGQFEFDQARFLLRSDGLRSTDEVDLHGLNSDRNDPFPVYAPKGRALPYVYFDSRTYGPIDTGSGLDWNYFSLGGGVGNNAPSGVARPYVSNKPRPTYSGSSTVEFYSASVDRNYYVNRDSFQIISGGVDDHYGEDVGFNNIPILKVFPDGRLFHPQAGSINQAMGYQQGDRDNVTNFSDGAMSSKLP